MKHKVTKLPSHQESSPVNEDLWRKWFGEDIGLLKSGVNLLNLNLVWLQMGTKPMHFNVVVLGPWSVLSWVQGCQGECSIVVFPDCCSKGSEAFISKVQV
jgi:hypothetical protein